VCCQAEVSTSG